MATAKRRRDTSVRPPGRLYPWAEWQDGRWWTIVQGEDFACTLRAMRDQLHVRARTTGVRVKTHTDKATKIEFVFQKKTETPESFEARVSAS